MDLALIPATLATLDLTSASRLVMLEARSLAEAHVPPFPPEFPALLTGVDSPELAAHLRDMLLAVYPPEHRHRHRGGWQEKRGKAPRPGQG